MKKLMLAAAALLLVPAFALAQISITSQTQTNGENRIVIFTAQQTQPETEMTEDELLDAQLKQMMISGAIGMRLNQARAQELFDRTHAGASTAIVQTAFEYVDDNVASLAIVWDGTQPDGYRASRPYSVAIDLNTGFELTFDQLFSDPAGAVAAMETIIERDYLEDMNAYVEAAELLPMPTDCFSFDENGLTVYYDDEHYRMLDGRSGSVTFYWYEIESFIGEESPVYLLSRPAAADAVAIRSAKGYFGDHPLLGVSALLGDAAAAYALTDEPDYTSLSKYYPLSDSALRGMAIEIPKYAQTDEMDTPICAVRHSRVSFHGLTTGKTMRKEIVGLLGEPDETLIYDEDDAYDMMLCSGESLIYLCEEIVLELHLEESGVLDTIILRSEMPQQLL